MSRSVKDFSPVRRFLIDNWRGQEKVTLDRERKISDVSEHLVRLKREHRVLRGTCGQTNGRYLMR